MIYLLTIEEQIKNALSLINKFYDKSPDTYEELKKLYIDFLKKRHPEVSELFINSDTQFITDKNLTEPFLKKATKHDNSLIDDLNQGHIIDVGLSDVDIKQIEIMKEALKSLQFLYEEFYNSINLVIPSVVFLGSTRAKGGSFSGLLGIIWCGIHEDWTVSDYQEFWIHESTHHFLFLDEIVHEHYDYDTFAHKENWSHSAILNIKRPLDKVFHSIAVAIEVIAFRVNIFKINNNFRTKAHPETNVLFKQIWNSLDSLQDSLNRSPNMLKERGYMLLKIYKEKSENLEKIWLKISEENKEIA